MGTNGKRKKDVTGKPRKAPDELKDNLIKVRVTDDQKRLFTDTADAEGLDVSSWLRRVGIQAAGGSLALIRAAKVVSDRKGGDK